MLRYIKCKQLDDHQHCAQSTRTDASYLFLYDISSGIVNDEGSFLHHAKLFLSENKVTASAVYILSETVW